MIRGQSQFVSVHVQAAQVAQIPAGHGDLRWLELICLPHGFSVLLVVGVVLLVALLIYRIYWLNRQLHDRTEALQLSQERWQQALTISQQQYQNLVENSPDIIERFDLQLRHLYVSPVLAKITGIPTAIFLGKTCRELGMDAAMVQNWEAAAARVLQTGEKQIIEFSVPTLQGLRSFEMAIAPELSEQHTIESLLCISRDITERQQAEIALQNSQARFAGILDLASDAIISVDVQQRITLFNQGAERIFGYTVAEVLGQPLAVLLPNCFTDLHPWHSQEDARGALLAGSIQDHIRIQGRRKDGSEFPAEASISQLNLNGELIFTTFLRDITDRQQSEIALRQSEEKFRMAIDFTYNWEYWQAPDGSFVYVSPSCERITGYPPAAFIENADLIRTIIHPGDRDLFSEHHCDSSTEATSTEFRIMTRFGDTRWIAHICQPVVNQAGVYLGRRATNRDISERVRLETERQQAEDLLRLHEEQLQLALEASGDGLWDWNVVTGEVYYSPRWLAILGYAPEDLPGTLAGWINLMHPDDKPWVMEWLQAHLQESSVSYTFDYRVLTKAGTWLWVANYGKVVARNAAGKALRIIGTQRDISDRKLRELALQRAMEAAEAANLAKSTFLANMSHELRTPLNVILGFAQVLAHDLALTPHQREDLQTIRRSGDHLLRLINDVLDLSKIEAGHYTLELNGFDLQALLNMLHSMMLERAQAKQLQLTFEIAPDVPQWVIADEQKLRQVLLNLLSNAIKFTRQGEVKLSVVVINQTTIVNRYSATVNGHALESERFDGVTDDQGRIMLQFQVNDTGIGIAINDQKAIFDAFVQAEAGKKSLGGTGLGLTICRKLLEVMHGEISVCSVPQVGSTFMVTVPVYPTSGSEGAQEVPDRQVIGLAPGQPHRRILVVDDQLENRLLLVRILTQLGLEVREAANGQEAIHLWQTWHPHLIWMDIRMPELDGYTATKWIRDFEKKRGGEPEPSSAVTRRLPTTMLPPSPVIIALTAQASHSDRALALAVGCNDYISKPFQTQTLLLKMAEHLGLEYIYAHPNAPDDGSPDAEVTALGAVQPFDPALLDRLPAGWLSALKDASLCGNDRAIVDLAAQLPETGLALRGYLVDLAHKFQFEQILDWVQYVAEDSDHASFT